MLVLYVDTYMYLLCVHLEWKRDAFSLVFFFEPTSSSLFSHRFFRWKCELIFSRVSSRGSFFFDSLLIALSELWRGRRAFMKEESLFVWNLVSSLEKSMSSAFGVVKKVVEFLVFAEEVYIVLGKRVITLSAWL